MAAFAANDPVLNWTGTPIIPLGGQFLQIRRPKFVSAKDASFAAHPYDFSQYVTGTVAASSASGVLNVTYSAVQADGSVVSGCNQQSILANDGFVGYVLPSLNTTATFTNGSANIGATNSLAINQAVQFTTTGTLPTNFVAGTTYFVLTTGNPFTVSATIGGSAIVAGSAGTGTQTVTAVSATNSWLFPAGTYTCNTVTGVGTFTEVTATNNYSTFIGGTFDIWKYQHKDVAASTVGASQVTTIGLTSTTGLSVVGSPTPSITTVVTAGNTGGTLSNGTYCYKISLVPTSNTASQDGPMSSGVCVTLSGGTSTQQVSVRWTGNPTPTGFTMNVFGRPTTVGGTFGLIASGQTSTTYNDLGSITPTTAPHSNDLSIIYPLPAIRAGTWSISAATTVAVTFATPMLSTPDSCSATPSASAATTGTPFATALSTTGFTVNVPTSGTLAGTYLCGKNNAN